MTSKIEMENYHLKTWR